MNMGIQQGPALKASTDASVFARESTEPARDGPRRPVAQLGQRDASSFSAQSAGVTGAGTVRQTPGLVLRAPVVPTERPNQGLGATPDADGNATVAATTATAGCRTPVQGAGSEPDAVRLARVHLQEFQATYAALDKAIGKPADAAKPPGPEGSVVDIGRDISAKQLEALRVEDPQRAGEIERCRAEIMAILGRIEEFEPQATSLYGKALEVRAKCSLENGVILRMQRSEHKWGWQAVSAKQPSHYKRHNSLVKNMAGKQDGQIARLDRELADLREKIGDELRAVRFVRDELKEACVTPFFGMFGEDLQANAARSIYKNELEAKFNELVAGLRDLYPRLRAIGEKLDDAYLSATWHDRVGFFGFVRRQLADVVRSWGDDGIESRWRCGLLTMETGTLLDL